MYLLPDETFSKRTKTFVSQLLIFRLLLRSQELLTYYYLDRYIVCPVCVLLTCVTHYSLSTTVLLLLSQYMIVATKN